MSDFNSYKSITTTSLGDHEVKVIDTEFYFKAFIHEYIDRIWTFFHSDLQGKVTLW